MKVILTPFMVLALLGFLASVVVHINGYFGIARPFGIDPWPLHVGIFVVWIPAVLVGAKETGNVTNSDVWKVLLRGCPGWMRTGLYLLFGYAILSFFASFIGSASGDAGSEASEVRGFSGHWMFFYYFAFAVLYSQLQIQKQDPLRRCRNGHIVEISDAFCRECGDHVGKSY